MNGFDGLELAIKAPYTALKAAFGCFDLAFVIEANSMDNTASFYPCCHGLFAMPRF
jgi:hypothetical protein